MLSHPYRDGGNRTHLNSNLNDPGAVTQKLTRDLIHTFFQKEGTKDFTSLYAQGSIILMISNRINFQPG